MDSTADIHIPEDHPLFAGHFPGFPIFPAVGQIDLIQDHLAGILGREVIILRVIKAKFPLPILPDSRLRLDLSLSENEASWKILSLGKICSLGTLQFVVS